MPKDSNESTLELRDFSYDSEVHCSLIAQWENDAQIRHLFGFFPDEQSTLELSTSELVRKRRFALPKDRPFGRFLAYLDDIPIGEAAFELDPPQAVTQRKKTAWLSLIIGDEKSRGRGLGVKLMHLLEYKAIQAGARQFELGVFEFNIRAIRLYSKLGYKEVKRLPQAVFWKGQKWTDIRMSKLA